jgi:hypothetical protein
MATQICPNCKANSFTWSIDEEESAFTKCGCVVAIVVTLL